MNFYNKRVLLIILLAIILTGLIIAVFVKSSLSCKSKYCKGRQMGGGSEDNLGSSTNWPDPCRFNHLLDGGIFPGSVPSYEDARQALLRIGVETNGTNEDLFNKVEQYFPRDGNSCDLDPDCGWCRDDSEKGGKCLSVSNSSTCPKDQWWNGWKDSCSFSVEGVNGRPPTRDEVKKELLIKGETVVNDDDQLETIASRFLATNQNKCGTTDNSLDRCGWCINTNSETKNCSLDNLTNNDQDMNRWLSSQNIDTSDKNLERCDLWEEYSRQKKNIGGKSNLSVIKEKRILEHPHLPKFMEANTIEEKQRVWTQFFKCNEKNICGKTGTELCCNSNGRKASKKYLTIQKMIHYLTLEKNMIQSDSDLTKEITRLENLANLDEHQKKHLDRMKGYNTRIQSSDKKSTSGGDEEKSKHKIVIDDYNSSPERKNRYLKRLVSNKWLRLYDSWQKDRIITFSHGSLRNELLGQIDNKLNQQRSLLDSAIENNEGPEISITLKDLNIFKSSLKKDKISIDNIHQKIINTQTTSGKCVSNDISGSCAGWWKGSKCIKGCQTMNRLQKHRKGLLNLIKGRRDGKVSDIDDLIQIYEKGYINQDSLKSGHSSNRGDEGSDNLLCNAYSDLSERNGIPDCQYNMYDAEGVCQISDTGLDVKNRKISCEDACQDSISGYRHVTHQYCPVKLGDNRSVGGERCYCLRYGKESE